MPTRWDADEEKKLLLAAIVSFGEKFVFTGNEWDKVTEIMGPKYSRSAIEQHFRLMRRIFASANGISTSSQDQSKATTNGQTAPKKGRGKRKIDDNDDDEESKKKPASKLTMPKRAKVKREEENDASPSTVAAKDQDSE